MQTVSTMPKSALIPRLDKVLAVTRYSAALYGYAARGQLVDFFEPFYDYIQRLTVIRLGSANRVCGSRE